MRGSSIALVNDAKQIKVTGRREHFIQRMLPVASSLTFGKDHKAIDLLRIEIILPMLYPDSLSQKKAHELDIIWSILTVNRLSVFVLALQEI